MTEECVQCRRDTSIGKGLFVDRISADRDLEDGTYIDGYMCRECLSENEKEFKREVANYEQ